MESKKLIYDIIPQYIPETLGFKKGTTGAEVLKAMEASGISYPCIAKPDIGCKGRGVEKLYTAEDTPGMHQGLIWIF